MPMGKIEITRPIKSLTVILRTCTSVNMLTQSKKRLFDQNKSEYTFRSLSSIINSLNFAKDLFSNINLELIIVDHNSEKNDVEKMKSLISNQFFKSRFVQLNVDDFKKNINPINEKNEKVTFNQISNMSNIHQSLLLAKESDGMINFTRCKYTWATNLWDTMEGNTWFPKEVQMTQDAKDYKYLTPPEKRMYDLVLSQLIFMDSLQTNNLMDNINPYITAPEINAIFK